MLNDYLKRKILPVHSKLQKSPEKPVKDVKYTLGSLIEQALPEEVNEQIESVIHFVETTLSDPKFTNLRKEVLKCLTELKSDPLINRRLSFGSPK